LPICQLCHCDRELRDSHIIPRSLYSELLNDKGHMMAINGVGNRGWKPLQDGISEYLFCEACEQHFNEHFEKPFRAQWILAKPLPNPWDARKVVSVNVDYSSFKLFHLSVLFRAGVCSHPNFAEVTLGPHQERLRQILLHRTPGDVSQYPICGYAVIHHETRMLVPIVSQAQKSIVDGHRCYGMIYGGVQWWIFVSSHRNLEVESEALQSDGRMKILAVPWNEIPIIQAASKALRDAKHNLKSIKG
jgi:hypothetical protein